MSWIVSWIISSILFLVIFLGTSTISAKIWFRSHNAILCLLTYIIGTTCAYFLLGRNAAIFIFGFGLFSLGVNGKDPVESPRFLFRSWKLFLYTGNTLIIVSIVLAIVDLIRRLR